MNYTSALRIVGILIMKPKQPREIAELKGATKKDPQRYRGEPAKSDEPIGDAPSYFNAHQALCWKEIVEKSVEGVLTGADRFILEVASVLLSEFRINYEEFNTQKLAKLCSSLSLLGMTPVDRQKINVPKKKPKSGFGQFTKTA